MLLHLHVKNLALIRETEIDFTEGLNILTGETGAGKSILIGSMTMALGGKVSREMVREDADYALVELVFATDRPEIRKKLRELDIPMEDDQIILSRKISWQQKYLQTQWGDCEHGGIKRSVRYAHRYSWAA